MTHHDHTPTSTPSSSAPASAASTCCTSCATSSASSVKAFDKAGGVGGTWYCNRYPGAKSDTEGFVYRYSFDKDLLQEWDWNTRYLDQPDDPRLPRTRRRPLRPAAGTSS